MFTPEYWRQEAAAFRDFWADLDLTPEQAALLIRGMSYLTFCTCRAHPEFRLESQGILKVIFKEACLRYGHPWFNSHLEVFNNHMLPCDGVDCPCSSPTSPT